MPTQKIFGAADGILGGGVFSAIGVINVVGRVNRDQSF
jgi:hypothetical protein